MPLRPRLTAFEIAWADAAFGAIFPPKSALAHGIGEMKPGAFLDAMLADIWLETSLGLRVQPLETKNSRYFSRSSSVFMANEALYVAGAS